MSCSTRFSMRLQTEILSTGTSDFLKQIIILKSFNSKLSVKKTIYGSTLFQSHACSFYVKVHWSLTEVKMAKFL